MKAAAFVLSAIFVAGAAAPARAQFGGALGKIKKGADTAASAKKQYDDWNVTDAEERQLGEQVSTKLRLRFGVTQDPSLTKYVTLVGTVVAQGSSRPGLDWRFIVLDTDGVNAYAAPGGFIHITRGLLGLMKNEAELAGVLGHEITHVTKKHTVEAIKRGKEIDMGANAAGKGGMTKDMIAKLADKSFQKLFDGAYSRADESEADAIGIQIASKAGYAANGLATALQKVADRNANQSEPNGFFVSHPVIKDRIAAINKEIGADKLAGKALVAARYKQDVTFDAKPLSEIPTVDAGASGLASGEKKKTDARDDSKKKGGTTESGGKQQASAQQTASAGARGGVPDRDAKGGSNPAPVLVKLTPAEITAFKKDIV
ncbi:MAG TPA: M48 family metalloprotease [Vicinamibacterales bacterium]|jgi:predicted Zn-dependent protease